MGDQARVDPCGTAPFGALQAQSELFLPATLDRRIHRNVGVRLLEVGFRPSSRLSGRDSFIGRRVIGASAAPNTRLCSAGRSRARCDDLAWPAGRQECGRGEGREAAGGMNAASHPGRKTRAGAGFFPRSRGLCELTRVPAVSYSSGTKSVRAASLVTARTRTVRRRRGQERPFVALDERKSFAARTLPRAGFSKSRCRSPARPTSPPLECEAKC